MTDNLSALPELNSIAISWRDVLPIHPAANIMPPMSDDELRELVTDIKAHSIRQEVIIYHDPDGAVSLLDGRSRLDAAEAAGLLITKDGKIDFELVPHQDVQNVDPIALALSLNVHRRHLKSEQKRQLIAALLQRNPDESDRAIGRQVGADNKTVAAARADLEAREEIPHVETRRDGKGRQQPARRAKIGNEHGNHHHDGADGADDDRNDLGDDPKDERAPNNTDATVATVKIPDTLLEYWQIGTVEEHLAVLKYEGAKGLIGLLKGDQELLADLFNRVVGQNIRTASKSTTFAKASTGRLHSAIRSAEKLDLDRSELDREAVGHMVGALRALARDADKRKISRSDIVIAEPKQKKIRSKKS